MNTHNKITDSIIFNLILAGGAFVGGVKGIELVVDAFTVAQATGVQADLTFAWMILGGLVIAFGLVLTHSLTPISKDPSKYTKESEPIDYVVGELYFREFDDDYYAPEVSHHDINHNQRWKFNSDTMLLVAQGIPANMTGEPMANIYQHHVTGDFVILLNTAVDQWEAKSVRKRLMDGEVMKMFGTDGLNDLRSWKTDR